MTETRLAKAVKKAIVKTLVEGGQSMEVAKLVLNSHDLDSYLLHDFTVKISREVKAIEEVMNF